MYYASFYLMLPGNKKKLLHIVICLCHGVVLFLDARVLGDGFIFFSLFGFSELFHGAGWE